MNHFKWTRANLEELLKDIFIMEPVDDLDLYEDELEVQVNTLLVVVTKMGNHIRFLEHQLDVLVDKLQGWWYN